MPGNARAITPGGVYFHVFSSGTTAPCIGSSYRLSELEMIELPWLFTVRGPSQRTGLRWVAHHVSEEGRQCPRCHDPAAAGRAGCE